VTPRNAPIPALTSIRFFLSVWVILFHLTVPNPLVANIPNTMNGFVYHIIRTAYSAVSLFFIISGMSGVGLGLYYVLIVIIISCVTYKWIEFPLNRFFRKKIAGSL
jgi:peptidoglycan/LPS O-acetylase OafA/YrhL